MKKPTRARLRRRCPLHGRSHRAHRPSAPPRSGKFAADRPRSSGPGCSFPHFSQRRTVSRGVCICSSASRSRRRFPTAAAAPLAPALPIARWRTCSIVAAPFGIRTRCPLSRRRPSARRRPRPMITWRSAYYNGVLSRSLRRLPPTDRDFHAAGGAFRHADARGLFTVGRSSYYNGVSSRSLRHPSADRPRFPRSRRRLPSADRPRPMIAWRAPQVGWFIFPIIAALFGLPTAMPIERRHPAAAERPRRVSPRQRGTHAPSFFPHMRRTGG